MGNGSTKRTRLQSSENSEQPQPVGKFFTDDDSGDDEVEAKKKVEQKPMFNLTPVQQQLIQDTWNNIDNKASFGKSTLKRIFTLYPDTKQLFALDHVANDEVYETTRFRSKADQLSTFIHTVVGGLSTNEKLVKRIAKIFGQEHFKPKPDLKIDFVYWRAFDDAVISEIESEQKNLGPEYSETAMSKNIKPAWSTFMTEVVGYAKSSYAEAKRSLNTKKSSIVRSSSINKIVRQVSEGQRN